MARANKFVMFLTLCTGMAVGSTAVNRILKPPMSMPLAASQGDKAEEKP